MPEVNIEYRRYRDVVPTVELVFYKVKVSNKFALLIKIITPTAFKTAGA